MISFPCHPSGGRVGVTARRGTVRPLTSGPTAVRPPATASGWQDRTVVDRRVVARPVRQPLTRRPVRCGPRQRPRSAPRRVPQGVRPWQCPSRGPCPVPPSCGVEAAAPLQNPSYFEVVLTRVEGVPARGRTQGRPDMRCYAAKAARKASLFALSPLFEAEFVNRQRSCRPCAVELPTAGGLRELMNGRLLDVTRVRKIAFMKGRGSSAATDTGRGSWSSPGFASARPTGPRPSCAVPPGSPGSAPAPNWRRSPSTSCRPHRWLGRSRR